MSFPVTRPTSATTTSTTSTIHEFICLFTHDLKRKTKRWQDGRLKYHVFNNRIMVYDDRGGNVGDAHWTASMSSMGSDQLDEGDEFGLDRGGAIVQVCERVGSKEVDLKELVDKRVREVEKRRREAAVRTPAAANQTPNGPGRPLNSMVTPARIGRATVPRESPYEQRIQRERGQQDTPPPAKRQKREASPPSKSTHARALFGTQLNLSAPSSSWARSQILRDRTNVRVQPTSSEEQDNDIHAKKVARMEDKVSKPAKSSVRRREATPDEENESLFVQEEAPRRPTVPTASSRLGGPRIERETPEHRRSTKQAEPSMQKPSALPTSSRTLPPSPSPQDLTMDDNDDCPAPEPEPELPRPSKSKLNPKPNATSRTQHTGPRSRASTCEETAQVAQMSKQPASPPRPAASSRQDLGEKIPKSGSETISSKGDGKREKRTELRIKARKKRGLLMLAQPEPSEVMEKAPPPASDSKVSSPKTDNAAFEAWLDDDGDVILGVGGGMTEAESSMPRDAQEKRVTQQANDQREKHTDTPLDADVPLSKASPQPSSTQKQNLDDQETKNREAAETRMAKSSRPSPDEGTPDSKTRESNADQVAQHVSSASPLPKSAKGDVLTPSLHDHDNSPQPKRRLRSKKQTTKPPVENLVPSPTTESEPTAAHVPSSESEDDWAGPPAASCSRKCKPTSIAPLESSDDANEDSSAVKPLKKRANAKGKKANDTGIRISRISKSCKSKVITGFVERPGVSLVPDELVTAKGRLGWGSAAAALAAEDRSLQEKTVPEPRKPAEDPKLAQDRNDPVGEESPPVEEKNTSKPPTRQISNPATRGRKAASKADAAGQVLQVNVPFDQPQPAPVRKPLASDKSSPAAAEAAAATSSAVTAEKELPGFAKANGGAWSRHADDLLGMGRPKRKKR